SNDVVHQGTNTSAILAVGAPISGTIESEPMAADVGISVSDGQGGYVDKDWYQVTLSRGQVYTFFGSADSMTTGLVDISLYGQSCTQVHGAVEGANPSFTFDTTYQTSATQVYYLAVSAGGANGVWQTATGGYSISMSAQGGGDADQIAANTLTTASLVQ